MAEQPGEGCVQRFGSEAEEDSFWAAIGGLDVEDGCDLRPLLNHIRAGFSIDPLAETLALLIEQGALQLSPVEGVAKRGPSLSTRHQRRDFRLRVGAWIHVRQVRLGRGHLASLIHQAAQHFPVSEGHAKGCLSEFRAAWSGDDLGGRFDAVRMWRSELRELCSAEGVDFDEELARLFSDEN
jgi:hypothetical protein